MPRKKNPGKKRQPYRPVIPIDWKLVENMILSGCNGREISGALGVCTDTFYDRFTIEKGVTFSEYLPNRRPGGLGMVKLKQFQSAMRGSNQMLTLLGKEWLGQGKRDDDEGSEARTIICLSEKFEKLESALLSRGIKLSDVSDEQSVLHQELTGEEAEI